MQTSSCSYTDTHQRKVEKIHHNTHTHSHPPNPFNSLKGYTTHTDRWHTMRQYSAVWNLNMCQMHKLAIIPESWHIELACVVFVCACVSACVQLLLLRSCLEINDDILLPVYLHSSRSSSNLLLLLLLLPRAHVHYASLPSFNANNSNRVMCSTATSVLNVAALEIAPIAISNVYCVCLCARCWWSKCYNCK